MHPCPLCNEACVDPSTGEPCPVCFGHGVVAFAGNPCSTCRGHRAVRKRVCPSCEGTGRNLSTIIPFTDPPLRVPVEAIKDALVAVRTGYKVVTEGDDEIVQTEAGEIEPGVLGLLAGLLVLSAERTKQGVRAGRFLRDILTLDDDAELLITPSGIWVRHDGAGALLYAFPRK